MQKAVNHAQAMERWNYSAHFSQYPCKSSKSLGTLPSRPEGGITRCWQVPRCQWHPVVFIPSFLCPLLCRLDLWAGHPWLPVQSNSCFWCTAALGTVHAWNGSQELHGGNAFFCHFTARSPGWTPQLCQVRHRESHPCCFYRLKGQNLE